MLEPCQLCRKHGNLRGCVGSATEERHHVTRYSAYKQSSEALTSPVLKTLSMYQVSSSLSLNFEEITPEGLPKIGGELMQS